jgi:hypothetical protein
VDDKPPSNDALVLGLLDMFGLGFVLNATDALWRGEGWIHVSLGYFVGAALVTAGFKWPTWKSKAGDRFVASVDRVAADARWWLLFLFLIFTYVGTPALVRTIELSLAADTTTWTPAVHPWQERFRGALWALMLVVVAYSTVAGLRSRSRARLKKATESPAAKGFLDFRVDMENASRTYLRLLTSLTQEMQWIGGRMQRHTGRLKAEQLRGGVTATNSQRIATDTANDIRRGADRLERLLLSVNETIDTSSDSSLGYMRWYTPTSDAQRAELGQLREQMGQMKQVATDAARSQREFQASLPFGISQDVNAAATHLSAVVNGGIIAMEKMETLGRDLGAIVEAKLK